MIIREQFMCTSVRICKTTNLIVTLTYQLTTAASRNFQSAVSNTYSMNSSSLTVHILLVPQSCSSTLNKSPLSFTRRRNISQNSQITYTKSD